LVAVAVAMMAGQLSAHHGRATFDSDRTITVKGVVTAIKWANPHVEIELRGLNEAGSPVAWVIESSPPNDLRRIGLSDFVSVGDEVEITAHPAREMGRISAWAISVLHANGTLTRLPEQVDFRPGTLNSRGTR
jgi:hypothetical protein